MGRPPVRVPPGTRFDRLVVVEDLGMGRRVPHAARVVHLVKLRCRCGGTLTTDLQHLRSGATRSCGCLVEEHGRRTIGAARAAKLDRRRERKRDAEALVEAIGWDRARALAARAAARKGAAAR